MMQPSRQPEVRKHQRLKDKFVNEVAILLSPDNDDGKEVITYLQRVGKQSKVRNFYVHDVIVDATLAGINSIHRKGEAIKSPVAWLKSIGAKCIRKQVRAEIQARKLKAKHEYHHGTTDSWLKLLISEEQTLLKEALAKLSLTDQELLLMKHVQQMSYKEIQSHFLNQKSQVIKEAALRKRESRALARLKALFEKEYE